MPPVAANDMTYFAPQARLVNVDSDQTLSTTATSDLVSVSVTQVNTGPAQVTMTVNNQWDVEIGVPPTQPFSPPWKYNALTYYRPGQHIRVDFRYGGAAGSGNDANWQTMIVARITNISFAFPSGGGATMTLNGEDLVSLLKTTDKDGHAYQNMDEAEMFSDVVTTRAGLSSLCTPVATMPSTVSTKMGQKKLEKKTQYLQFVQEFADRLDNEIWADDGSFDFNDVTAPPAVYDGSLVNLHFEPARSLTDPSGNVVTMRWGASSDPTDVEEGTDVRISDFTPKLQIADQYTGVSAAGSDPSSRQRVTGTA